MAFTARKPSPWSRRARARFVTPSISLRAMRRRHSQLIRIGDLFLHLARYVLFFVLFFFVFGIALRIAGFTNSASWLYFELVLMFLCLFAALVLVGAFLSILGMRRLGRDLIASRCQRCIYCFYDLSSRPRILGTCPECGVVAPRRECVRLWCRLLRSRF